MPSISRPLLAALLGLAVVAPLYAVQPYPSRPIALVVISPPGGSGERLGRIVGSKVAESLGQPVILDFKPGASGLIAEEAVVRAAPDGHVLLLDQSSIAMNPALLKSQMRFDVQKDLQPVSCLVRFQHMLVVSAALPARNVKELVEYAKANAGKVNYSTPGSGTPQHVLIELFMRAGGIGATHIPYPGGAPALLAVVQGEVQTTVLSVSTGLEMAKSGKVRALAVMDDARAKALPDTPTFAELGFKGLSSPWLGVFAPGATPAPIVQRLNAEFVKALKDPKVQEGLAEIGMQPIGNSPAECARMVGDEIAQNQKLVKELGLKVE
ncbi:MAG: tripartite tricarboxylate transporter substrate binding protein [Burkholderiales bacterium]|nr:tripartite tricarboxylate transporter substrate binding protein [Burkholderiales bacterium]